MYVTIRRYEGQPGAADSLAARSDEIRQAILGRRGLQGLLPRRRGTGRDCVDQNVPRPAATEETKIGSRRAGSRQPAECRRGLSPDAETLARSSELLNAPPAKAERPVPRLHRVHAATETASAYAAWTRHWL